MAASLSPEEARALVTSAIPLNGSAFRLLGTVAQLAAHATTENDARDLLVRLLDRRAEISDGYTQLVESLTARLGLYPYLQRVEDLATSEQIAFEYHRPSSLPEESFVFHSMQQSVYEKLMSGKSVVLSAPTSFGKSVIVDALVSSRKWQNIVIVVPTLALIDETRRRLARFSNYYKILTHPQQALSTSNLLIMTQERLLEVEPLPPVDFFVIDEFYKLDNPRDPERTALLNIAWDRLHRTGAQYYLIGPNITGLAAALPDEFHRNIVVTDFRTVAVDQIVVSQPSDWHQRLSAVCSEIEGPTLIYCQSPKRVREVGAWLLESGLGNGTHSSQMAASWVGDTYDPEWTLGKCLERGIGLHHGRVPRSLQHHMVRLFNSNQLSYLVCTSTLIEGVNTAARNVIVVDGRLARRSLDYFTFSNIRGRAGRMFRNFVGKVYVFSPPPDAVDTMVDIPIASQSRRATNASLIQLPFDELEPEARERVLPFYEQNELPLDTIRRNRGIDPEKQLDLARELASTPVRYSRLLSWSGMPTFDQAVETYKLILDYLVDSSQKGPVTARSIATRLNAASRSPGDVRILIEAQVNFTHGSRDDAVEDVLFFLRNWMGHMLPTALMALDRIQRDVFAPRNLPVGSYSFYAGRVERQFLPQNFTILEEYGLPVQVAMKLRPLGLQGESLDVLLNNLKVVAAHPVTPTLLAPFELDVLDEVVAGLGPQTAGLQN